MDGSKNYADIVEFPVEIVSRDGAVRFYSYEDSVRLYQRRISMASLRFQEPEQAAQEASHCQARIDQLRRSYYRAYGWGTAVGAVDPEEILGTLVGEVAAFLRSNLGSPGRLTVRVELLEARGALSRWYVLQDDDDAGLFLDVFRLDPQESEGERKAFVDTVVALQGQRIVGGAQEKLVAFRHVADCGLILTGRADQVDALVRPVPQSKAQQSPWDWVTSLVYQRRYDDALRLARELVKEQPWHLSARVVSAGLAVELEQLDEAEAMCRVGLRHFPGHPELHYLLALSLAKMGRIREALPPSLAALEHEGVHEGARLLAATLCLSRMRPLSAWRITSGPQGESRPGRRLRQAIDRLRRLLLWGGAGELLGVVAVVIGIGALASGPWASVLALSGLLLCGLTAGWGAAQFLKLHEAAYRLSVASMFRRLERSSRSQERAH
ncbi:MAG: tetratricopeptide repeat protein [Deltaproteobacteria bacterium]|nr:tetratricopeptide repeat protein [Deltaproteobacteria bacterium]